MEETTTLRQRRGAHPSQQTLLLEQDMQNTPTEKMMKDYVKQFEGNCLQCSARTMLFGYDMKFGSFICSRQCYELFSRSSASESWRRPKKKDITLRICLSPTQGQAS